MIHALDENAEVGHLSDKGKVMECTVNVMALACSVEFTSEIDTIETVTPSFVELHMF